jgi:hypothetical protein
MGTPLVSVIVPTYGRAAMLAEALGSVAAQTVEHLECIVVDDAGPDAVETDALPDARFTLIRLPQNRGPSAARNVGLRAARGEYVAFLDDDDVFTPERIAIGLEGVDRAPVVICLTRYVHGHVEPPRILNGDQCTTLLEGPMPHIGQAFVARSVAAPFDERLRTGEDWDWWIRMSCAGPFLTVERFGYLVRAHDGPRAVSEEERLRNRLTLLDLRSAYFAARPRAAAVQWLRVGQQAILAGDYRLARDALTRSFKLHPSAGTARVFLHASAATQPVLSSLRKLRSAATRVEAGNGAMVTGQPGGQAQDGVTLGAPSAKGQPRSLVAHPPGSPSGPPSR